jgi:hypothetical protein
LKITKEQLKKKYLLALIIISEMEDLTVDAVDATIDELLDTGEIDIREITLGDESNLLH